MPAVNSQGVIIPEITLTRKEKKRISFLSALKYPDDEKVIFHLRHLDFRIWIYALNPRDALLLTSTEGLSKRVREQMNPTAWKCIKDFFWRVFN
jgi:hypothetical protein